MHGSTAVSVDVNHQLNLFEAKIMRYSNALVAAAFCAGLAGAVTPAAAINCEGNFQVQKGGQRIATPFCEDGNLAAVAREYGSRTTAEEMRGNPNEKERICHFIGDDNRVRDTCAPYRNDGHGSDWR